MKNKKGKLAFIKKALRPSNIGKIVTCKECIGFFQRGQPFTYNGEKWLAVDTDHFWVITCPSGIETLFGKSIEAVIPDSWLSPIDDLPPEDDSMDKVKDFEKELIE